MDEKIGGDEAQVCRLCGQFESIYIDVFGEEGTRRLLGLKIHSKINILIKQDDELPKTVCIRCVGTLEYVCDFMQQCQETQQMLIQKTIEKSESDEESNKENIIKSKKNASTPEKPSSPQETAQNTLQPMETPEKPFPLEEKILNEIHQNRNTKKDNVLKPNMKIRSLESLKDRLFVKNSNSIPKFPMDQSKENIKTSEEQFSKKIIPEDSQKITKNAEKIQEPRLSPKPVEIRPTLRKFMWNPDSFPVKTPEIENNVQLNQLNSSNSEKMITPLDEAIKYLLEHDKKCKKVEEKGPTPNLLSKIPENNNQSLKKDSLSSSEPLCDLQNCKFPEKSQKPPENPDLNTNDLNIDSKKRKFRESTINSKPLQFPSSSEEEKSPQNHQKSKTKKPEETSLTISSETPKKVLKKENEPTNRLIIEPKEKNHQISSNRASSDESSSEAGYNSETSDKTSRKKRRKSSGAMHGTISQLISKEEKEAIEQYYTIDMSSVNDKKVEENLKYLNKKQTMCTICNTIYPRMDKCRVHIWGHLDMKPYKCKACDFATVTVTNIRCHIRKSHLKIKPFECNFCKKRYVTAVLLQEHLNTHSGLRPYKCKICEFSSASRQVLSYHMTTHKTVKDVTCDICGKEFFSKGRMRAHMITHNKNKELMCKYCSHHFSNVEALNKHYDNVHSKDYTCDICGKTTKSRKALHNHQNVHSEAKYKCTLCPNVYKSGHILKEHLLKHKGIRKYKCEQCDKDFAQQSHLAAHMAVHSEKRFKCPGCQRAFNRHDNMKIHTKRCSLFTANPELKDLLVQRVKKSPSIGGKFEKKNENFKEIEKEGVEEVEGMDEAFRIGQVVVIPISSVPGNNEFHDNETVNVTESILDLECF